MHALSNWSVMTNVLVLCLLPIAQATAQHDPGPPVPVSQDHFAAADIDGDGLLDFLRTRPSGDVIEIWKGVGADAVALADTIVLPGAAGVAVADIDRDGLLDIVVGSLVDQTIRIGYGGGDFTFVLGNPIDIEINPHTVVVVNACDDLSPEILAANAGQSASRVVIEPATAPLVLTPTEFEDPAVWCGEVDISTGPCNDYTEPDCDSSPTGPGVQECMRAALCRSAVCHWAACILCHDGNGCHFWERPEWVGANLACGLVTDIELAGCLTAAIPPSR